MHSSGLKLSIHHPCIQLNLNLKNEIIRKPRFLSSFIKSTDKPIPRIPKSDLTSVSCFEVAERKVDMADRVRGLSCEFRSLSEPIDKVKRLLHYASFLPPFDGSARTQGNRVLGCTAQVWLEVTMDNEGLMRFRVDSDSEITKGFCSCLIWLLDGAAPEEVLSLKTEDLWDMNVGLPSRGRSRVNTWHNVLISMQRRTEDLRERSHRQRSSEDFSSFLKTDDGLDVGGSYKESQIGSYAQAFSYLWSSGSPSTSTSS